MVHQEGGLYFQTNFRKGFVQSHLCELVNLGVYICIYIYIQMANLSTVWVGRLAGLSTGEQM